MGVVFHRNELNSVRIEQQQENPSTRKVHQKACAFFKKIGLKGYEVAKKILPFQYRVIVSIGEKGYQHCQLIKEIFTSVHDINIEGLSQDSTQELVTTLDQILNQFHASALPLKLQDSKLLKNCQKKLIQNILMQVFSVIPQQFTKDITPEVIRSIFEEGYVKFILDLLADKATDLSAATLEELLVRFILGSFEGSSELKMFLKKSEVISSFGEDYLIDLVEQENQLYSVKLTPSDPDQKRYSLDKKETISSTFTFENLSKEKVQTLFSFVQELLDENSKHLSYKTFEIPDAIAALLEQPYKKEDTVFGNTSLFQGSQFLSFLKERASAEIFQQDLIKADHLFFSLAVAEICLVIKKGGNDLKSSQIFELLTQVHQIKSQIAKCLDYPEKITHLDTLSECADVLKIKVSRAIKEEKAERENQNKRLVIPPVIWTLLNQMIPSKADRVFIDGIFDGVEYTLGKKHAKFIQAIKNEYLLSQKDEYKAPPSKMKEISSCAIMGFVQFFLIDLLSALLGNSEASSEGVEKFFHLAFPAIVGIQVEELIPEEIKEIYQIVWNKIACTLLPYLIYFFYRFFINESIKQEIDYQLEVLDACSFKTSYQEVEASVVEDLDLEDENADVDEILDKLKKNREAFNKTVARAVLLKEKEKSTTPSYAKSIYQQLTNLEIDLSIVGIVTSEKESFTSLDAQKEQLAFWQILVGLDGVLKGINPEEKQAFSQMINQFLMIKTETEIETDLEKLSSGLFLVKVPSKSTKDSFLKAFIREYIPSFKGKYDSLVEEKKDLLTQSLITYLKNKDQEEIFYDCSEIQNLSDESIPIILVSQTLEEQMTSTDLLPILRDETPLQIDIGDLFFNVDSSPLNPANLSRFMRNKLFPKKTRNEQNTRIELSNPKVCPSSIAYYFSEGHERYGSVNLESLADVATVLKRLKELNNEIPFSEINHPDQLFAQLELMENQLIRQIRIVSRLSCKTSLSIRNPHEKCVDQVLFHLENNLSRISVLYDSIDSPLYSLEHWTVNHTNQFCRWIRKLNQLAKFIVECKQKFRINHERATHDPLSRHRSYSNRGYLIQANLNDVAEKLLARESSNYRPLGFSLFYLVKYRESMVSFRSSLKEKETYSRLALSTPAKVEGIEDLRKIISKGMNKTLSKSTLTSICSLYQQPVDYLEELLKNNSVQIEALRLSFYDWVVSIENANSRGSKLSTWGSDSIIGHLKEEILRWANGRSTILPQVISDLMVGVDLEKDVRGPLAHPTTHLLHHGLKRIDHAELVHSSSVSDLPRIIINPIHDESGLEKIYSSLDEISKRLPKPTFQQKTSEKEKEGLRWILHGWPIETEFINEIIRQFPKYYEEIGANRPLAERLFAKLDQIAPFYSSDNQFCTFYSLIKFLVFSNFSDFKNRKHTLKSLLNSRLVTHTSIFARFLYLVNQSVVAKPFKEKDELLAVIFLLMQIYNSSATGGNQGYYVDLILQSFRSKFLDVVQEHMLTITKKVNNPKFLKLVCKTFMRFTLKSKRFDIKEWRFTGLEGSKISLESITHPETKFYLDFKELSHKFVEVEASLPAPEKKPDGVILSEFHFQDKDYYQIKLKELNDRLQLNTGLCIEGGKRYLLFMQDSKVQKEILLSDEISDEMLSEAIRLEGSPYVLFPQDIGRIPAILKPFVDGKTTKSYVDNNLIKYLMVGQNPGYLLKIEEEDIGLVLPQTGRISSCQILPEADVLGSYLVFENDSEKFVIYENPGLCFKLGLSVANSPYLDSFVPIPHLKTAALDYLASIPELKKASSSVVPEQFQTSTNLTTYLDSRGALIPQTSDEFAFALSSHFNRDQVRFAQLIDLLIQKIEIDEVPDGKIKLSKLIIALLVAQNAQSNQVQGNQLLKLAFKFIQKVRISNLEENTLHLLAAVLPIYLKYAYSQYYQYNPLPQAVEAIFLNELFSLTESGLASLSRVKAFHQISKGIVFSLIYLIVSEDFGKHLLDLDRAYPQSEGLNLIFRSKKMIDAFFRPREETRGLFKGKLIHTEIGGLVVSSIALQALQHSSRKFVGEAFVEMSNLYIKRGLDFETLVEEDARVYFRGLAKLLLLYDHPSSRLLANATKLKNRLNFLILPACSSYEALRLLKFLMQKKEQQMFPNVPSYPEELTFFLKEQYKQMIQLESGQVPRFDWKERLSKQLSAVKRTYSDPANLVSSVCSIGGFFVPNIYGYFQRGIQFYNLVHNLASILREKRLKEEISHDYISFKSLFDDGEYLQHAFVAIGNKYFSATARSEEFKPHLKPLPDTEDDGLQGYVKERLLDSYQSLQSEESEALQFELKLGCSLDALRSEMMHLKTGLKAEIKEFSTLILKLANKDAKGRITIDDLYALALEKDAIDELKAFLKCSESVACLLLRRVTQLALYESYLTKTQLILDEIESSNIHLAAHRVFEEKHYSLDQKNIRFALICLVFEARSKVWLRPLQVRQMKRTVEETERSVIVEMIPGSGKTTFGIVLDLHHSWKKGELPLVVFTKELITSTKKDLAERFFNLTKKQAFFISIDRERETKASLKHLLHRFKSAQNYGDVIISTKEDIQSLELLYLENLLLVKDPKATRSDKKAAQDKIEMLKELLKCLASANTVVDECHEILKPDEIEKYPVSEEQRLTQIEIQGVEIVFKHLVRILKQRNLSLEDFLRQPELEIHLQLCESIVSDESFYLSQDEQRALFEFISSDANPISELIANARLKELFAMIRGTLNDIMSTMKEERINTDYGLSKEKLTQDFVIPYFGNNTPIEEAIFESPHETLFKTYCYYLTEGLQEQKDRLALKLDQLILTQSEKLKLDRSQTPIYRYCLEQFGLASDLGFRLDNNPDVAAILFVTLIAAPQIKYYNTALESTSMNFSSMLGKTHYFSGTIYNKSLYPRDLLEVRSDSSTAKTIDIIARRIQEFGTILSLNADDPKQELIDSLVEDPRYMMLIDSAAIFRGVSNLTVAKELAERFKIDRKEIKAVLFFDQDNLLKSLSTTTLEVELYKSKELSPEERFTYLDQMHTFGVDIPQKKQAGAMIVLGDNNLAELEQAAWRLRGLETMDQFASLALMPNFDEQFEGDQREISFEYVVQSLLKNELSQLKPQTLQANFQMIKDFIRKNLMRKMISGSESFSLKVLDEFGDLFIQEGLFTPSIRYGAQKILQNPKISLGEQEAFWLAKVEESQFFNESEKEQIGQYFLNLNPQLLPTEIKVAVENDLPLAASHGRVRQRVKQKTTLKQEMQQQTVAQEKVFEKAFLSSRADSKVVSFPFMPWPAINLEAPEEIFGVREDGIKFIALKDLFEAQEEEHFVGFSELLSDGLKVSNNVIPFGRNSKGLLSVFKAADSGNVTLTKSMLASGRIKSILIVYNKVSNEFETYGLSVADHIIWDKSLLDQTETENYAYGLCNTATSTLIHRDRVPHDIIRCFESQAFQEQLLGFKIFNFENQYSADEMKLLKRKIDHALRTYDIDELVSHVSFVGEAKHVSFERNFLVEIIHDQQTQMNFSTLFN